MILSVYCKQNYGAQARIAKECGIAPSYMYQIVKGIRPVPIRYCSKIEQATNGIVTRKDLRPDDYWEIWSDLPKEEKSPV